MELGLTKPMYHLAIPAHNWSYAPPLRITAMERLRERISEWRLHSTKTALGGSLRSQTDPDISGTEIDK